MPEPHPPATYAGKIARLPREIRTELNRRLTQGEPGASLVEWLNSLPETEALKAAGHGGRPITEANLEAWRRGGFEHWRRQQELCAWMQTLAEQEKELKAAAGGADLFEQVTALAVAALNRMLRELPATTSPEERSKVTNEVARQLENLRRASAALARARRPAEKPKAGRSKRRKPVPAELTAEEKIKRMRTLFGPPDKFPRSE